MSLQSRTGKDSRKEAEKCAVGSGEEVARSECKICGSLVFLVSSKDFHGIVFLSYFFFFSASFKKCSFTEEK